MYGLLEKWVKKGLKMGVGYDIQLTKSSIQDITKK